MSTFKKFISYYKPYKILFFIDMFCAFLVSAVDLLFPQILRYVTNTLIFLDAEAMLKAVLYTAMGLFVLYVLRYFSQFFITSWGHIMGARMESDMRRDLFSHLQRLPFSYYDRNNTGEMLSKLVSDLFDITELAHHGPENLFISLLKIIGSFLFLLMINVPMTLVLAGVTLIMVIFTAWQNGKMRSIFTDNRRKIARVNAQVQDSLAGIRVVKSFANESMEQEKFNKRNEEFLDSKVSSYKIMGRFFAGNAFFEGLLFVAVIVTGVYFIYKDQLSPGDLAVYVLYINIYLNPINVLLNFTEMFQKGMAGFKRFNEVLDTVPDIKDSPQALPIVDVKGEIEFIKVGFSYTPNVPVLHNIQLKIKAGLKIALVGPSGGGKTTICSLIPRFYEADQGSITIDGKDIREITLESLRNSIGIVQQEVYLFGGTIRENIAYGKDGASDEEIREAASNADIDDFILSLPDGYETFVGERGVRLSGGQKQRISIAQVFLKNPPVLILDEATSALDNESERHIQKALDRLSANRTTLVIAHRLSTIRNADEILVVTEGEIRERGTHNQLKEKEGIYAHFQRLDGERPNN